MKSYMYMIIIPFILLAIGLVAMTFTNVSNNSKAVTHNSVVER